MWGALLTAGGSGNTGRDGWLGYVSGELGDDWPVSELEGALTCLAGRVAEMRADPTTHNSRLSDDMNHINPALTGACGTRQDKSGTSRAISAQRSIRRPITSQVRLGTNNTLRTQQNVPACWRAGVFVAETLCQQMLGGLPTGRNGFPLHSRFRYFDAELQR